MIRGKKFLALVSLVLIVAFVVGCVGQKPAEQKPAEQKPAEQKPAEPAEIKIGLVTPITGDVATFGAMTKRGTELAVKQINDKGGVLGKKIVVVTEDDKNQPTETAAAVQ
ncbi:MAG: ABC transporter substrate-binding protein, partial [Bacillota bacterium]